MEVLVVLVIKMLDLKSEQHYFFCPNICAGGKNACSQDGSTSDRFCIEQWEGKNVLHMFSDT